MNTDDNSHPHITIGGADVTVDEGRLEEPVASSPESIRIQVETPSDHISSTVEDSNRGFKIGLAIAVLALIGAGAVLVLIWRLVRVSRKLL